MIRAVIIDDEQHAIDTLSAMLSSYDDVETVGFATSVDAGVGVIQETEPDLIFLDVEMGDGTGFDLLQRFDKRDFQVVFMTAYEQYAINAFKFSAIEYLLKPLISVELSNALKKASKNIDSNKINSQLSILLNNVHNLSSKEEKVVLKELEVIHIVEVADILWCSAEGSYCTFYLNDGQEITISKSLKEYEDLLKPIGFYRIHRSYLVNLKKIKKFSRVEGGTIILEGDVSLPVSTRKRDKLTELLERI